MVELLDKIGKTICEAANAAKGKTEPCGYEFFCEWLECRIGNDGMPVVDSDVQYVVNARKINQDIPFTNEEYASCFDQLANIADSIARAFNAALNIDEEDTDAFYANSEANWFDKNGDECLYDVEEEEVTTVQRCIFNA